MLHDPRAWLGTAFHEAMEQASTRGATAAGVANAWRDSVDEAAKAAARHPLDARFTLPEKWPGFYLTRQRALASASEALRVPGRWKHHNAAAPFSGTHHLEKTLVARGGRLVGRPDRYDGGTITEYKSTLPDPQWPRGDLILEGFRRQLKLYAAIIAETSGRWPLNGRVVSASGQTIEVPLSPAECDAEADRAVGAMEELNARLRSGGTAEALARPSAEACTGCPFQIVCPAFWKWLDSIQAFDAECRAGEGTLQRTDLGQDGDLYSAFLVLRRPAARRGDSQPLVLRRSVHGDWTKSPPGAKWRVTSARVRPDGRSERISRRVLLQSTVCRAS